MNKKPGLLFAVCLLAIIVLSTSFNMNFGANAPVKLPHGVNPDSVLYVCPATDSVWHNISSSLQFFGKYAYILFFFAAIVLFFSWSWAFYQNLLKDKFNADAYKNSWDLTKVVFWASIVCVIIFMTPNHFRRVEIRGHGSDWVMCENTSDGAKAVKFGAITNI